MVLLTVEAALTPMVSEANRLAVTRLGDGFARVVVRYGFAESPDIPAALAPRQQSIGCNPVTAAYFLNRQTLIPARGPRLPAWQEHLFAAMVRNSETPKSFFKLPVNRVVELGSLVEI